MTDPPVRLPRIDPHHSTNVTALAGQTTVLNCRVHGLGNRRFTNTTAAVGGLVLVLSSFIILWEQSCLLPWDCFPFWFHSRWVVVRACTGPWAGSARTPCTCWRWAPLRPTALHCVQVGRYTYTSDLRWEAAHSPHSLDWALRCELYNSLELHVHYVACRLQGAVQSDSGLYQCQVSTTPILARDVWLAVLGGWNESTQAVQC